MDRFNEASNRVDDIMTRLVDAGFSIGDPWSIERIILPDGINYSAGATRLVVWDEHEDYVVKIALTEDDNKYSVKEVELYHAAVKVGLEDCFGWCEEITYTQGRSICAMEFLYCNEEEIDFESYDWDYHRYCVSKNLELGTDESKKLYADYHWDSICEDMILEWLEDTFTKEMAAKFDSFIDDYNVTDIHTGNIGVKNGKFALCDYGGFGW